MSHVTRAGAPPTTKNRPTDKRGRYSKPEGGQTTRARSRRESVDQTQIAPASGASVYGYSAMKLSRAAPLVSEQYWVTPVD